jgi:hypothetical protein
MNVLNQRLRHYFGQTLLYWVENELKVHFEIELPF